MNNRKQRGREAKGHILVLVALGVEGAATLEKGERGARRVVLDRLLQINRLRTNGCCC